MEDTDEQFPTAGQGGGCDVEGVHRSSSYDPGEDCEYPSRRSARETSKRAESSPKGRQRHNYFDDDERHNDYPHLRRSRLRTRESRSGEATRQRRNGGESRRQRSRVRICRSPSGESTRQRRNGGESRRQRSRVRKRRSPSGESTRQRRNGGESRRQRSRARECRSPSGESTRQRRNGGESRRQRSRVRECRSPSGESTRQRRNGGESRRQRSRARECRSPSGESTRQRHNGGESRRQRSRTNSLRRDRQFESGKQMSRNRSRSRIGLKGRRHLRSCSGSRERTLDSDKYAPYHDNANRLKATRESNKKHTDSTGSDDYYHANKQKRLFSRSPRSRKITGNDAGMDHSMLDKFLDILKDMKNQSSPKLSLSNVIPEFDPMSKDQTILMWLTKVEECSEIYGWNEKECIHFALPKLAGIAKSWYQGLSTVLYSWNEWKRKLIESFPCREDYAELLTIMLAKRARCGESLESYYYEKMNLINRCGITGRKAVDCILSGIDDRAVRVGAQAAQFREPEEALMYLKTVKVGSNRDVGDWPRRDRKVLGLQSSTSGRLDYVARISCYNCNEPGHKSLECQKPPTKCTSCGRLGHMSTVCRAGKLNVQDGNPKMTMTKDE